jgi:hypothetical protein
MNQLEIYEKLRQLQVIPAGFTKVNRQVTDKNVLWWTIEYNIDDVKKRLGV